METGQIILKRLTRKSARKFSGCPLWKTGLPFGKIVTAPKLILFLSLAEMFH
jgi:hypothetical protein